SQDAVRTGDVFDNDGLCPTAGKVFSNDPCRYINGGPGRKRYDQTHRALRPVLGRAFKRQRPHAGQADGESCDPAIYLVHVILHRVACSIVPTPNWQNWLVCTFRAPYPDLKISLNFILQPSADL